MRKAKRYRSLILLKKVKEENRRAAKQKPQKSQDAAAIERRQLLVFLVCSAGRMLQMAAEILIVGLACIGLIALIQPESRDILYQVMQVALNEIGKFTGLWAGP